MKRVPKYKTDPKVAYRYAKKNGPLSVEEEKVFLSDNSVAFDYALNIKKDKLSELLENSIFENLINQLKTTNEEKHSLLLNDFFKYIKMTKSVPSKYLKEFLDNTSPEMLYVYAQALNKRLSSEYEKKMFKECVEQDDLWPITEYQFLIKKVPEYMHNFMLAKNLEDKGSSNKNAVLAYFLNLKKLKKTLQKLYDTFEDKNIKLKDVIDGL